MATTTLPDKLNGTRPTPAPGRDQAAARWSEGARRRVPVGRLPAGKAVVVHSGARDAYQVARALDEAGRLECLVTDLYWPADRAWAGALLRLLPASLRGQLLQRNEPALRARNVRTLTIRGVLTLLVDKAPRVPFAARRAMMRATDAALGRAASRRASWTGATVFSYSYYGFHALGGAERPGVLFQLHPHPASMRSILERELVAHPECAESLGKEWELALPEEDFERLVEETRMAAHTLVASSFTRDTLIEHGTSPEAITVIPYGVDCARFCPDPEARASQAREEGPLRLLFVGRINQRKGIRYLLEALRLLEQEGVREVHLTVCGRVVDDLAIFKPFAAQVDVRPDVSHAELVEAYRGADLFVFPSVAEGFGHVLLEALACGLPVLSTTHTAAPDLINEGVEGWVVPPARPDLLASRIAWACTHREALAGMRTRARERAEQFSWARFRASVATAFGEFLAVSGQTAAQQQEAIRHV